MKKVTLLCCCFLQFVTIGCAQPPVAKVTLHVINQEGVPLEDAEMIGAFCMGKENIIKKTNNQGYVTFTSPVIGGAVFSNQQYETWKNPDAIDYYYFTLIRKEFYTPSENTTDGKWQPWNPIIECVLKERLNPIPMYATSRLNELKIPLLNTWCGFDMTVNDWISPYGSGAHADIEICYQWDGSEGDSYNGSTLEIRFPDEKAGYYTFQYPYDKYGQPQCSFISPYHAEPTNMFSTQLSFSETIKLKKYPVGDRMFRCLERNHMKKGTGYIFRTRTRFDENGNLIGAHYGKIYPTPDNLFRRSRKGNAFLRLRYYLNPTENDTNLEYDPNQNLLMEKVNPTERWKYMNIAP